VAKFDESKHKRDESGRFAEKDSGDSMQKSFDDLGGVRTALKTDTDGFVVADEFRYDESHPNAKMRHPHHIYAQGGEEFKSLQLTHSPQIKGRAMPNIKMHKPPNPKDKKEQHFVPQSETRKKTDFGKARKNWSLSQEDDQLMKPYRDKPFNDE